MIFSLEPVAPPSAKQVAQVEKKQWTHIGYDVAVNVPKAVWTPVPDPSPPNSHRSNTIPIQLVSVKSVCPSAVPWPAKPRFRAPKPNRTAGVVLFQLMHVPGTVRLKVMSDPS